MNLDRHHRDKTMLRISDTWVKFKEDIMSINYGNLTNKLTLKWDDWRVTEAFELHRDNCLLNI